MGGLYYTLIKSPPPSLPLNPSLPHLKQLQEASLFYLIRVYEVHQSCTLTLISFFTLPHTTSTPPTVPILQSWFSLLIFKLMFEGVSQCIPAVRLLFFGPFHSVHYSPSPLYLPHPIFQQLSVHILMSSTFTSYGMRYYWCSTVLSSFP
jgi:hypothetical protein